MSRTYEAIVKGHNVPTPGVPESFKVLVKELQSLCLDIQVLDTDGNEIELKETRTRWTTFNLARSGRPTTSGTNALSPTRTSAMDGDDDGPSEVRHGRRGSRRRLPTDDGDDRRRDFEKEEELNI